jgi:hypothetical protein
LRAEIPVIRSFSFGLCVRSPDYYYCVISFRCLPDAATAPQHGHRSRVLTSAHIKRARMVAIEFGMCRSGRKGGSSGSVIVGYTVLFGLLWSVHNSTTDMPRTTAAVPKCANIGSAARHSQLAARFAAHNVDSFFADITPRNTRCAL